jgi:hypothetical protein
MVRQNRSYHRATDLISNPLEGLLILEANAIGAKERASHLRVTVFAPIVAGGKKIDKRSIRFGAIGMTYGSVRLSGDPVSHARYRYAQSTGFGISRRQGERCQHSKAFSMVARHSGS